MVYRDLYADPPPNSSWAPRTQSATTVIHTGLTPAFRAPAPADRIERGEREYAAALGFARDLGELHGSGR